MPLDTITVNHPEDQTDSWLAAAGHVQELGILPVSLDLLAAHRERMARMYSVPAGLRRPLPLGLSSLGALLAGLAAVAGASPAAWIILILGGVAAAFAASVRSADIARRSVSWVERVIPAAALEGSAIPVNIRSVANDVRRKFPDARFVIGELRRKSVVLDPYLVVEHGSQRVVLGIWDGEQVVACARRL